jgi:tetratricopeptide (TPR) repeat protein
MGVAFDRVADVRARRPDGKTSMGSGYLLGERLVLTAAHVVFTDSGAVAESVKVRPIGLQRFAAGRVVWPQQRGDVDAAVVEITDADWRPPRLRPVRWGRLTGQAGRVACEAVGFPRILRELDGTRESEQLDGHLNPGTRLVGRRYDVHIDSSAPTTPTDPDAPSPWAGMSGAGLFAGELLIGVVVIDAPGFGEHRLTAVPVLELAADPDFRTLMAGPSGFLEVESVELAGLFAPPPRRRGSLSPAELLRADLETVRFRGREQLLAELNTWCESEDDFGCWLLVGPGGQGKSRLAREFSRRRREAGWIAGLVASTADEEAITRLGDTTVKVLLVVDYAETRSDQLQDLIRVAWERSGTTPIRLLLLARSPGEWWPELRRQQPDPLATSQVRSLPPLEDTVVGRLEAFQQAVGDLAQGLSAAEADVAWSELAAQLTPPDLTGPQFGSALTVHMTALTRLLQAGPHPVAEHAGDRPEDVLLDHEQGYWTQTAAARQLTYHPQTLRNGVAAATLCGAATRTEALATVGRVPGLRDDREDRQLAVATWLRDLYPTTEDHYWGSLQPDRLGEHFIDRVVHDDPELLGQLLADASDRQVYLAVTVLARGTSHQPHLAGHLRELITADPGRLAPVAVRVATETANPQPLIDAVRHAAVTLSLDELMTLVDGLPHQSFNLAQLAADLTQRATDVLRQRALTEPETFLPILASSLNNLSIRLGELGRREEALAAIEEAVPIRRGLAEARPDVFQPDLAGSLNTLSTRLAELGRREDALAAIEEAVGYYRALVDAHPDTFQPKLALALNNLSISLAELGRREEALAVIREAVGYYRTLADAHPAAFLPDLAKVLNNKAIQLANLGRREEAVTAIEEAAGIRQRLGAA